MATEMAAQEQIESLQKKNRDLLNKLKKQAEKLNQITFAVPREGGVSQNTVCEALTAASGPKRGTSSERNGERTPNVTSSHLPDKWLDRHFENPGRAIQKPKPSESSDRNLNSLLLHNRAKSQWRGQSRSVRLLIPKSAPLATNRETRVTDSTLSVGIERDSVSERHIPPLLGYDWFADTDLRRYRALLDTESSLTDRSEQFFRDIHSFRQVYRDDCIHGLISGLPSVADLVTSTLDDDEPAPISDMHQCTFCYRINSRLFAVPLDSPAACPVCQKLKSEHPHTDSEPALIRVSVPRSALLPAHEYKAHRRSSFDPSDSLSLPSHCLSGWSNGVLNSGMQMSNLDLRSSLKKPLKALTTD